MKMLEASAVGPRRHRLGAGAGRGWPLALGLAWLVGRSSTRHVRAACRSRSRSRRPSRVDSLLAQEHFGAKGTKLTPRPTTTVDDETFLRRVSLDLIGTLPAPEEVIRFALDPARTSVPRWSSGCWPTSSSARIGPATGAT